MLLERCERTSEQQKNAEMNDDIVGGVSRLFALHT